MADKGDNQQREAWFDFLGGIQADRPRFMVEPRHTSRMSGFYVRDGELNRMPLVKVIKNFGADFVNEKIQGLHEWLKPDGNWEMLITIKGDIYTWDYSGSPSRINVLSGRGEITSIAAKVVTGEARGADWTSFILELLQGSNDGVSERWWGAPVAGVPDQFKLDADAETKWGDINYVDHHTRMTLVNDYAGTTGTALNAAWSVRKCFGTTARIFCEDIHDAVLIWSDAGTRLFKWDGTTFAEVGQRTWQDFDDSPIQGPGTKWVPVTEGSGSLSGKYKYRAVYVDADGNYSAPSDVSAAVTVTSAASIRHNDFRDAKFWPVGTETVRLYRTKALPADSTNVAILALAEAEHFLAQGYFYTKDSATWYGSAAGYHRHRNLDGGNRTILSELIEQLKKEVDAADAWDINTTIGLCSAVLGFGSATQPKLNWRQFCGHLQSIIDHGNDAVDSAEVLSNYAFTIQFDTDDSDPWDDTVLDAGREVSDKADAYESNLPPRHSVTALAQFAGRLFYSVERSTTPTDALAFENYGETYARDVQVSGRIPQVSGSGGIGEYQYGGTYVIEVGTDYQAVTALFILNGELFAAKENGIWRLDMPSSDPVDWGFIKQTDDANALNSAAVCVKGSVAFLLGKRNNECRLWLFDGRRAHDVGAASSFIDGMSVSNTWTSVVAWSDYVVVNQVQAQGSDHGDLVALLHEKAPGGIFEWRWKNANPLFSSPKSADILGCDFDANSYPQVVSLTEISAPDDLPNGMTLYYVDTPETDGGDPTVLKIWQNLWVELWNTEDNKTLKVTAYFDRNSEVIRTAYALPNEGAKFFLQEFSLANRQSKRVYFRFEFGGIAADAAPLLRVYSAGVRFVRLKTAGKPVT